ncbi:MAG: cellulase family glycosylhydrolase [Anaerolineae bacterium]|nr:cellulase family glycosylhydrolase [Anaerolineae bacterium]
MGGTGFTLQWPVENGQITTPFDSASGSLQIAAPAGTHVLAPTSGTISVVTGDRLEINAGAYRVSLNNLRAISVSPGQPITVGSPLGESAGPDSIELSVWQAINPTPLLPTVVPPPIPATPPPSPTPPKTALYVTPTQDGVRVRERPIDGNPIALVNANEVLEVIESPASARPKLGVQGQWVNIRTLYGTSGFSAAHFLREYTGPIPTPAPLPSLGNISGVNLDLYNRLGHPHPDRLKGIGWIRVKFNVSFNPDNGTYGNTDIMATFNRVRPFLQPYVDAGIKVVMVFTHQLYGEGAGYLWPAMDTPRWNSFIPTYADFARRAAALFAGLNLVHAYQIWNEQDTNPAVARAAVPIPAGDYANLLAQTIRAIRSVDSRTLIITGGHVCGPGPGSSYAQATIAALPPDVRPDGIASHPYGRGVSGHPFSNFGALDDEIRGYGAVLPGRPIWFTEWGVLDRQGDMSVVPSVMSYASGFMNLIKANYPGQVAAAIWYAWADGMDNGYGLVGQDDQPKEPLYTQFRTL